MKLVVHGAGWFDVAFKGGVLLCAVASMAAMAQAAPDAVVELKPEEVAAFLAKHPYAVVQATSPDSSCTYCVGADKVFDQAAAQKHSLPWVFARVQWSPWNKTPDFGDTMKVYGAPAHFVFLKGQPARDAGGRPVSANQFAQTIARIAGANGTQGQAAVAGNGAVPKLGKPATEAPAQGDMALSRLMARDQFLARTVKACGQMYPNAQGGLTAIYQQWQTANKAARDAAAMQLMQFATRQERAPFDAALRAEKASVQKLLTQDLGIDWKKKPTAAQCGLVVDRVTKLPVP
ncbi:hypothetical protein [Hydrogenophaga sp. PAMC20947]|uniref:hypothetical protein n=1 Tax=Hydrogenophaga sp. PAMC20947 TaxID=2565558 RepID=UPI00109DB25A|nr:hypothetical protein [Hydrogenophaga sp. PAMC20947]QCB47234.1 hypothetical protein E5678_15090 [Hydrogenophaga sp. PAMC20947]